ncbi:MAG: DegT/DnrJ/EryC1/StrS family aminotransferase [Syntrophales bacterium]|nr:DegT/DnrJ/EryC1/StrS family aminotransferase [Syntrophales bacterium]
MIPHSRPTIGASDIRSVQGVLESGCLIQGEQVRHFEEEMADYVGVKSAVAVNSGTSALHVALLCLDIGKDDEIIIPSFVCTALLNAVRYVGATPVLADIDERHFNLDVADVKQRITRRTKAIIVPHLFGQAADLEELLALGIPIIEDCAQSMGSLYRGKMTGRFGILSIFSFYATKLIATGEGGMVMSNQAHLTDKIRDLRDYDEKDDGRLRYNYKMTDIQAALGRSQLLKFTEFLKQRNIVADHYNQHLKEMNIDTPFICGDRSHIYYRYVIRHKEADSFIEAMSGLGISCRRPVYRPLHHYFRETEYPSTDRAWRDCISIPIYPSLTESEMDHIVSAFRSLEMKG